MRPLALAAALTACGPGEAPPAPASPTTVASAAPASEAAPPTLAEDTAAQLRELEQGKRAIAAGQMDLALRHLRAATAGPRSGAAISATLAAADLLEQAGRVDDARRMYEGLLKAAGQLPEVQFAAGRFYGSQEDPVRAADALRAAIKGQPDFLPAYPLLAGVLHQTARSGEAAELLVDYERRLSLQIRRLADPKVPVPDRVAIIDLLATLPDDRAAETLRAALGADHPHVRMAAAGAVADDPEPAALEALAAAALAEKDGIALQVMKAALLRARDRARGTAPATLPPPTAPATTP